MFMTRIQSQILIYQFNLIKFNQQIEMDAAPAVNYVLSPFEGDINNGNK